MKKKYALIAAGIFCTAFTFGQAVSLSGTHNWTDGTAWTSGTVPASTDDVIISAGTIMNLSAPLVHDADITVSNNGSLNSSNPMNTCTVNDGTVTLLGFGAIVNFLGSGAPVAFTIDEGNLDNGGVFMVGDLIITNTSGAGLSVNNGDFMTANTYLFGDLLFDNNLSMNITNELTIDDSCTLDNANNINATDVINDGTLYNYNSINCSGNFENTGTYFSDGYGTFIGSDFDNDGTSTVQDSMDVGNDFSNFGTFSNDTGSVNIQNDFYNEGTVTGSGDGNFLISNNSENDATGTINGDINICDTTLSTQYLDIVAGTIDYNTVTFCGVSYASLDEMNALNISIYPNPSEGTISISGVENGVVAIYSMDGRLLYQENYNQNEQIDLGYFNSGTYILKYSNTDIHSATNFIIK